MGYRILRTVQEGLSVEGEAQAAAFMDALAYRLADERLAHRDEEADDDVRRWMDSEAANVAKERDLAKKAKRLAHFLEDVVYSPFRVELVGGRLEAEYEEADGGDAWYEGRTLEFLYAIAPYVRKGAYLGFVGEDLSMWSYTFDGKGSFRETYPEIDWAGNGDDALKEALMEHIGHRVEIACYGDPKNPKCVTLEDLDANEIILDSEIYTIVARSDV